MKLALFRPRADHQARACMHVLLIGIDAYPTTSGYDALAGCVNDIDAIQRILIDRLGVAPENIVRLASPRRWTA